MSAAASAATRPTPNGWCRISRRCSTTTPADPPGELGLCRDRRANCFATESKPRSAGCCARCASTAAALPPASTPTATARRVASTPGTRPRSTPSWEPMRQRFFKRLHAGSAAWLGRQADHHRLARRCSSGRCREQSPRDAREIARRAAKSACVPGATTRCWPTGTAWRSSRLAEASRSLNRPDWLEAAKAAYRFVRESERPGRPTAALDPRRSAAFPGDVVRLRSDGECRDRALRGDRRRRPTSPMPSRISTALDRWYIDDANAGHYLTAADSPTSRSASAAMSTKRYRRQPARSSRPSLASQRRRDEIDLLDRAWAIAKAATGRIRDQAYGQAGIVNACTILEGSRKLVLVEDHATRPRLVAGCAHAIPIRAASISPAARRASRSSCRAASMSTPAGPAAWLCLGQSCLPPISDPDALERALRPTSAPLEATGRQVFIESKKSPLVLVCFSLSMRNSIASVVPIGARMRRSTKIFCRSARGTSRSSLRVPDFRMSMAG